MSSLTISLIQTTLHWEDMPANLAMLEKKIMGIQERTEVVVLPEMFSTGFSMKPKMLDEKNRRGKKNNPYR
jgi:omega-amidase